MNLPINIELPNGFLEEESRCGYTISPLVKAVWAVELDLYRELERVCDKYGLILFADAGTILGAVRHSGFIPWDDDMDFSMTRKDYKKLCEVAINEFKPPYFWQTEETDPGSCRGHGQLRNSETTAIRKDEEGYYNFNQGIFIDVFPLDNISDDTYERHRFLRTIQKYINKKSYYRDLMAGINKSEGIKRIIKKFLIDHYYSNMKYNKAYKKLETLKLRYENITTKYCVNLLYVRNEDLDYQVRPKSWYDDFEIMPYENTTVKVPIGYKECLEKGYGNWKQYVIGGTIHGEVFFDPYKSYKEYVSNNRKG